jgi:Zn-dependent alcohol dehydrogenase
MDVMLEIPANLGMVIASKTVKGCWYGSSNVQQTVPQLLQLHRDGKLMLDELISRTITINDVNEAFEAMEKGEVARSVIEY